ncbi:hypothetical protein AA0535_1881 [Asaia krungthepensis NRIC 0535]|uniref:Transporter n=2 Tax=Asaia krungthepensis TaxID=220990 RepID=A0ABQ0Q3L8_9PROT|nr:hypothetical protein AA0535_1881 [Asaia krungthepensis NRIC 0535]
MSAGAADAVPLPRDEQWYTGSLISPSGPQFKAGVLGLEPYLTYNQAVDYLGSHGASAPMESGQRTISNSTMIKYGLTDHVSIQLFPAISYGWKRHDGNSSGLKFGDLPVDFLWRFLDPDPKRYIPVLSLFVGMLMPTGDYTNLGRSQDGIGNGAYVFRTALVEQSTYQLPHDYTLRLRMWGTFRRAVSSAQLANLTSYGTTKGFVGRGRPGMSGQTGFSLEFGFNQRLVLAVDMVRDWANGARVWGYDGKGRRIDRISASSGDWMVAPALEYSWSPRFGVVAGASAFFAGHNTSLNVAPQIAVNMMF